MLLASCDGVITEYSVCKVKEFESENKKCLAIYMLECFEMKIHIELQDLVLKCFMACSHSLLSA